MQITGSKQQKEINLLDLKLRNPNAELNDSFNQLNRMLLIVQRVEIQVFRAVFPCVTT